MLTANHLSKSFAGKLALQDVSFALERGEIYGLLGHNGAGKSTTLGIILGMVQPTHGDVEISGISVAKERSRALRKVGAIFEAPAFYDYLTGWQNLRLLMGYSKGFDEKSAREMVAKVQLTNRIHSQVKTYSHGMRQRLALAQALLPEPEILLLDEPTDGLDPEGIKWFRDFILELRDSKSMTVLFNSHLLAEVELMCDRIAILREGKKVFEGTMNSLNEGAPVYEVELEPWELACEIIEKSHGEILKRNRITLPLAVDPAHVVSNLVQAKVSVRAFAPVRRSLEDFYMKLRSETLS